VTRTDIEGWLAAHRGLTWAHEPELPVDDIDLVASVTNNARDIPIDEPTVERYVAALNTGATFPPIIVRRLKKSLVVLGGNHRTKAYREAGRSTIDAYVVECPDTVALEVAYGDNATNGLPPTDRERLTHALALVAKGRTVKKAAGIVGIDPQRIHKIQYTASTERRAAELGIAGDLARCPSSIWPRLASLSTDRVFTAVTKTIAAEGIGTQHAIRLIGDLNAQPNSTAAIDLLAVHVDEHRAARSVKRSVGRPSTNPYLVLRSTLGTIRGLNPSDVVEAAARGISRAELARLALDGARHLKAIHDLALAENPAVAS
jgi:uncharacterized ParB-like nuclease family protein